MLCACSLPSLAILPAWFVLGVWADIWSLFFKTLTCSSAKVPAFPQFSLLPKAGLRRGSRSFQPPPQNSCGSLEGSCDFARSSCTLEAVVPQMAFDDVFEPQGKKLNKWGGGNWRYHEILKGNSLWAPGIEGCVADFGKVHVDLCLELGCLCWRADSK